jgi:hypothetical protein
MRYNDELDELDDHEMIVGVMGNLIKLLPVEELSVIVIVNEKIIQSNLEDDGSISVSVISED